MTKASTSLTPSPILVSSKSAAAIVAAAEAGLASTVRRVEQIVAAMIATTSSSAAVVVATIATSVAGAAETMTVPIPAGLANSAKMPAAKNTRTSWPIRMPSISEERRRKAAKELAIRTVVSTTSTRMRKMQSRLMIGNAKMTGAARMTVGSEAAEARIEVADPTLVAAAAAGKKIVAEAEEAAAGKKKVRVVVVGSAEAAAAAVEVASLTTLPMLGGTRKLLESRLPATSSSIIPSPKEVEEAVVRRRKRAKRASRARTNRVFGK